jgi:hypothetical protein
LQLARELLHPRFERCDGAGRRAIDDLRLGTAPRLDREDDNRDETNGEGRR